MGSSKKEKKGGSRVQTEKTLDRGIRASAKGEKRIAIAHAVGHKRDSLTHLEVVFGRGGEIRWVNCGALKKS